MDEIWKKVDEAPEYQISNQGRLKNKHGRIQNPRPRSDGYIPANITINGKFRSGVLVHRLVAKAFVPNPLGKEIVTHLNGNRGDNRAENVKWSTIEEKSSLRKAPKEGGRVRKVFQMNSEGTIIKEWSKIRDAAKTLKILPSNISACASGIISTAGGFVWKYFDSVTQRPLNEIWKNITIDDNEYEVSNTGFIKTKTGVITKGSKSGLYLRFCNHSVHRLVASAFCLKEEGTTEVNHIDGDKHNNNASNLEWVTQQQNSKHARQTGLINPNSGSKNCRAVRQLLSDGTTKEYSSSKKASQLTGVSNGNLTSVCQGNRKTAGGYGWEYV